MTFRNRVISMLIIASTSMYAPAADYKTPAEMTKEDWQVVNTAEGDYIVCLQEKIVAYGETSNDPRVISDRILDECSNILINLDKTMGERNINPNFTRRYIYNMKNKSARKMLKSLMMMIAARQQQSAEPASEPSNEAVE